MSQEGRVMPGISHELYKKLYEQALKNTLAEELISLPEEEKLSFMKDKRDKFKEGFEEAGGDYPDAQNLHYYYHQYCGSSAGFYRDVSKSWRRETEINGKKLGLDKIPLVDSWVTWGADIPEPPKDEA